MLDTIALQKKGIPTVTLSWDTFIQASRLHAKNAGIADVPIVVVPYWVPEHTPEIIASQASKLLDNVIEGLASPLPVVSKAKA